MARTPLEPAGRFLSGPAASRTRSAFCSLKKAEKRNTSGLFVCLQGPGQGRFAIAGGILLSTPGIKRENILAKWGLSPSFPKICLVFGLLLACNLSCQNFTMAIRFRSWLNGESEMKKTPTKAGHR